MAAAATQTRPRIVIVGGGFGGLAAAKTLKRAEADITLVDRRNHHLFQPLLYQVATAALSPAQIAQPIRAILRAQTNTSVILDEVTGIDRAAKTVTLASGSALPFDTLILATGASHAYFGHDDWAPFAPGLKSLDDATAIRRRILEAFERAEVATDEAERSALLTFAIVGAGPTGVEMAGAIAELAHRTLAREFRHIDTMKTRIVLIEAGPRVLAAMPPSLSDKGLAALKRLGVEVQLGRAVTKCSSAGIEIGDERIDCRTIIWAAGVQASLAAHWLGPDVPRDRAGRVQVSGDLSVPGAPDIFVIGDTAAVSFGAGKPVPGVAPAAKQMGRNVANRLLARLKGRPEPVPFTYSDQGNLATIGRGAGLVDLGWLKLSGALGWWFWGLIHIFFLIDFRNRVSVSLDWLWSYLTYGRSARLMTEGDRRASALPPSPAPS
jgi:NADH dehydrogenase